jgi:hypothetical protein
MLFLFLPAARASGCSSHTGSQQTQISSEGCLEVTNCAFSGCHVSDPSNAEGGAIFSSSANYSKLFFTLFHDCSARSTGGNAHGGAVCLVGGGRHPGLLLAPVRLQRKL